ncbi:MAG: hypothetical protein FJ271_28490 [Planctomycetes bacterium]|nr:hypothetical protein [Planctomycetota bacterium]
MTPRLGTILVMLSAAERARLAELEAIIEKGKAAFREVALALLEIRDRRLYLATHANFNIFCRDRCRLSGKHAARLVKAARVLGICRAIGLPEPQSLSQAQAAGELLDEDQAAQRKRAHDGEQHRARHNDQAAEEYLKRLREILRNSRRETPANDSAEASAERRIRLHVGQLRRICDLHPAREKAGELLDYYMSIVLP